MSAQPLKDLLGRLAALMRDGAQADQAARIDTLIGDLDRRPLDAARSALALYEGEAPLIAPTQGEAEAGSSHETALAAGSLQNDIYEAALGLWHGLKSPSKLALSSWSERPRVVVDHGGGNQVWARGSGYIARYDCGDGVHLWRDDPISLKEAEQAQLGPSHFNHMVGALQARLKRNGVDPHTGSADHLSDPV